MYIVTFYSFKGGTGRSMALVNVAAELLRRGRRVLIVDFDLEAPGLDTFPFSHKPPIKMGLVDLIHDYLDTREVPPIEDYVYETGINGVDAGRLWIMPSGRQDVSYDTRFKSIDWQSLYENEGGFLLIEDLKIQWQTSLKPDYVLIDSRTGHTDIGGICTRQLPDCVVAMFFPNEQNLRGLSPVVQDIRQEESGPLAKKIHLHFVMANVPDLDDEDEILSEACARSQAYLGYESLAATIHHFNSLSMLEQRLFVIDRARSKLAQEYRDLVDAIVRANPEDRDGAIAFLDEAFSTLRLDRDSISRSRLEDRLRIITAKLPDDVDVLRRLARIRRAQRRPEEASGIYDRLVALGSADGEIYVAQAELLAQTGKIAPALDNISRVLALPQVSPFNLSVAVKLKVDLDPDGISQILGSPAAMVLSGDQIGDLSEELQGSRQGILVAEELLRKWLDENRDKSDLDAAVNQYRLCLIGSGKYVEAMESLCEATQRSTLDITDSFNYGMASWAHSGVIPVDIFSRVVGLSKPVGSTGPNYAQCLSIAYWAVGSYEKSLEALERSRKSIISSSDSSFSPWSYLYLSADRFLDDLYELKSMIDGFQIVPRFMRDIH